MAYYYRNEGGNEHIGSILMGVFEYSPVIHDKILLKKDEILKIITSNLIDKEKSIKAGKQQCGISDSSFYLIIGMNLSSRGVDISSSEINALPTRVAYYANLHGVGGKIHISSPESLAIKEKLHSLLLEIYNDPINNTM